MARNDSVEYYESEDTAIFNLETIKQKAVKGIIALTGRTFILQAIALFATFALTVLLDPAQYGTFFVVSAVINFFAYFSDVGLAAALIQKKDALTKDDLRTTFTVQQILVVGLIAVIFLATPFIKTWQRLDDSAVYLLWALTLSLLFSSLKTIPSVLLERRLDFNKLVLPQIIETLCFYSVVVYMAWKGYGIQSFTVAVLVRGLAGLIVMYLVQPWKPLIGISRNALKELFRYGLPYQTNTFLAVIKDDGMTAFLGGILSPASIGFLGWANKWGSAPLRFFMDQVIRVTFPAFARIQDDKEALSKLVSKSIFFICLVVFPSLVLLIFIAPLATHVIPRYEKWQPALVALSFICINAAWAAVTTPLTNMLNAIGKIKLTFKLMIMWTVLTWICIPAFATLYGATGAAAGFALVGSSSIVAIFFAAKYVKIDFLDTVGKVLFAAFIMAGTIFSLRMVLPVSLVGIIILIIGGGLVYLATIYLLYGKSLFINIRTLFKRV